MQKVRWLRKYAATLLIPLLAFSLSQAYDAPDAATTHQAPVDPRHRLHAYRLSQAMESGYDAQDNRISTFWYAWDSLDILDSAVLGPQQWRPDFGPEPTDTSDAYVRIRAAWGDSGIYLFFLVRDNSFAGISHPQATNLHMCDAIEVNIDPASSNYLYTHIDEEFCNIQKRQATLDFGQIQINFGPQGLELDRINWNWVNPQLKEIIPLNPDMDFLTYMVWHQIGRAPVDEPGGPISKTAAANSGLFYNTVPVTQTLSCQEWHIRWRAIGHPSGLIEDGSAGDTFAIALGYSDLDAGEDGESGIRWRNLADPFMQDVENGEVKNSVDCWGDLILAGNLEDSLATQRVSLPDTTGIFNKTSSIASNQNANEYIASSAHGIRIHLPHNRSRAHVTIYGTNGACHYSDHIAGNNFYISSHTLARHGLSHSIYTVVVQHGDRRISRRISPPMLHK